MTTQSRKPEPATTFNESEPVQSEPYGPIALKLGPALRLTESQMLELCALNDALRIELNAKGELELLPPTGMTSGNRNANIVIELGIWARADGRGEVFDSNTGYTLPNGAVRSPNASWILKSRLTQIPDAEKRRFARIVPDFVIELRSESDRLPGLQAKLEEYLANGVRLGWLIDPLDPRRRVYVYRPDAPVEILEGLETLSGEPELPGFTLDLRPIWEPAL